MGPDKRPRKLRGHDVIGEPAQIFVSRGAAADLLGVTPVVIDRAIRAGKIIRRKIGRGRQMRELLPYREVMALADDFAVMHPMEDIPQ